jgi:hypothetical protein
MWFCNLIEDLPPFALTRQKTAPLHQSQMFRSNVVWHAAILSQFSYGVPAMQQQLHHPQPRWMR